MDDLIGRWISGEAAAGEELYRSYFGRVKRFLVKLGEKVADAEDVAQQAMLAGLEGLKGGSRPDQLTYWLLGIARNINARRTRLTLDTLRDQISESPGGRTLTLRGEMAGLLDELLQKFSPRDREVLQLRHRENLSRKEIADRLEVPVEAIHARLERAYARLRQSLSRHFTTLALGRIGRSPVTLEAVRRLRPAFRHAVEARHLEDLSETAAAARLGVPVRTLQLRLQHAYEILRCQDDPDFKAAREEYRAEREDGRRT